MIIPPPLDGAPGRQSGEEESGVTWTPRVTLRIPGHSVPAQDPPPLLEVVQVVAQEGPAPALELQAPQLHDHPLPLVRDHWVTVTTTMATRKHQRGHPNAVTEALETKTWRQEWLRDGDR